MSKNQVALASTGSWYCCDYYKDWEIYIFDEPIKNFNVESTYKVYKFK